MVLAGGRSSRMGREKALLTVEEGSSETWLDRAVGTLLNAGASAVWISVRDPAIFQETGKNAAGMISDLTPDLGPLGGLKSVLQVLSDREGLREGDGVVVLPVDMPSMLPETIQRLVNELQARPECEAIHYYGFELPIVLRFSTKILARLRDPDRYTRYAVHEFLELLSTVALPLPKVALVNQGLSPFLNVNSPEDLHELSH